MSRQKMMAMAAFLCAMGMSVQAAAESFIWPVPGCGRISSPYGPRGSNGYVHSGMDISCGKNEPIVAAAAGTVTRRTTSSGQCTYSSSAGTCPSCDNSNGNSVFLTHDSGMRTAYLHLQKFVGGTETVGTKVTCGQQIGVMGTTGCSTGTHLHFMVYNSSSSSSHTDPADFVYYGKNDCPVSCVPETEICDGKDNDCDGAIDEGGVCDPSEETKYQPLTYDPQNTDINGDGYADICGRGIAGIYCALTKAGDIKTHKLMLELSDKSGWGDVSNYATIRFADINGDGKADVCARADAGIMCWPSEGTKFGSGGATIAMSDADGYNEEKYYSTIRTGDINGDGKDDICARFKTGFRCYPSTGTGWGTPIELGDMSDSSGWGKPEYYSTIRMSDVNGDGMVDVCGRGSAGFRCWISQGTQFTGDFIAADWSNANKWNLPQYYTTIRMPDLNGDGMADICARDSEGVVCHLSKGVDFGDEIRGPSLPDAQGWGDYDNYSTFVFGDINGDHKDDMCVRANKQLVCWLSTGKGFGQSYGIADFGDDNGWNKPSQYRTIRMGDVNGDGKAEVCGRFSTGVECFRFTGSGFESMEGPTFSDAAGWGSVQYYSTLRIGGPLVKSCSWQTEICDGKDNNCNGKVDEDNVCCKPSEEICDGKDNDCDGEIDEGDVCKPTCTPREEVCDGIDNDCDGEIDEGDVCDSCEPSEEVCDGIDNDCDGEIDEGDVCDSCEPKEEICDGKDNDCDGEIDEGGVCEGSETCIKSPEVCDGIDNDCDGEIDEGGVCGDEPGGNEPGGDEPGGDEPGGDEPGGDDDSDSQNPGIYHIEPDNCSAQPQTPVHQPFALLVIGGLLAFLGIRRRKMSA